MIGTVLRYIIDLRVCVSSLYTRDILVRWTLKNKKMIDGYYLLE